MEKGTLIIHDTWNDCYTQSWIIPKEFKDHEIVKDLISKYSDNCK
jgi:hypothetical protein